MLNLRYGLQDAHEVGEDRHAQEVMRDLGIGYQKATPQSISDSWWFWNCTNAPSPLPPFLSVLNVTPHDSIGRGLSQQDADELVPASELTVVQWNAKVEARKAAKKGLK